MPTPTRESNIQRLIQVEASRRGYVTWRNNVGTAWQGNRCRDPYATLQIGPRDVVLKDARPVHFGLHRGSSDLIGFRKIVVTPDMVGNEIALFAAIEVKTPRGKPTEEQANFLNAVKAAGGIAAVCRGVEDLP